MDSIKIGRMILELRKQNNLTQAQLAEKLNVSDKAVSKWEVGNSIPDLQQLESITKMFNISYDTLLNGDIEELRLSLLKAKPKLKGREKFNPKEWYSLDNAAKVYPPQATANWNMVFRMAAVMKQPVDIDILNKALEDMVDRFPTFMVTIKRGVFWYYFERVEKTPVVVRGGKHPCQNMILDGKKYLFRVTVENNRIACEFFHSLTDGTGGSIFLISLITRYYELKFGPISDYKSALSVLDKYSREEIEDSFAHYAQRGNYGKRELGVKAYHLHSPKVKNNIITHVVMSVDALKTEAKKYDATITVFLTAVLIKSFLKKKSFDRDTLPLIVQMPVNLRKKLPSTTLRNFAYFTGIETSANDLSFEEAITITKEQMAEKTNIDYLMPSINSNMREERNPFLKIAPLVLKNLGISLVSKAMGDAGFTTIFSNVGNVNAPDELKKIVDRFEFVLKEDRSGGVSMSGISFNNRCTISFIRSIQDNVIEKEFVRCLTNMGIETYVESNGGNN